MLSSIPDHLQGEIMAHELIHVRNAENHYTQIESNFNSFPLDTCQKNDCHNAKLTEALALEDYEKAELNYDDYKFDSETHTGPNQQHFVTQTEIAYIQAQNLYQAWTAAVDQRRAACQ
jgi:hypothetical protein